MDKYVYYYPGAEPDIAVVEADSVNDAILQLKEYFTHVSAGQVVKIDCHRKGYADGIMIISKY